MSAYAAKTTALSISSRKIPHLRSPHSPNPDDPVAIASASNTGRFEDDYNRNLAALSPVTQLKGKGKILGNPLSHYIPGMSSNSGSGPGAGREGKSNPKTKRSNNAGYNDDDGPVTPDMDNSHFGTSSKTYVSPSNPLSNHVPDFSPNIPSTSTSTQQANHLPSKRTRFPLNTSSTSTFLNEISLTTPLQNNNQPLLQPLLQPDRDKDKSKPKRRSSNPSLYGELGFFAGLKARIRISLHFYRNTEWTKERLWELGFILTFWSCVFIFLSALMGIGYTPPLNTDATHPINSHPSIMSYVDVPLRTEGIQPTGEPTGTQEREIVETMVPYNRDGSAPLKTHQNLIKGAMRRLTPGIWKMGKGSKGDRERGDIRKGNREKMVAIMAGDQAWERA